MLRLVLGERIIPLVFSTHRFYLFASEWIAIINSDSALIIDIIAMIMIVSKFLLDSSVSMVISSFLLDFAKGTIFLGDIELIPVSTLGSVHIVLTGGLHNITAGSLGLSIGRLDQRTTVHLTQVRVESGCRDFSLAVFIRFSGLQRQTPKMSLE